MTNNKKYQTILGMSYAYFRDRVCTAENINKFLDYQQSMLTDAGVSRNEAYAELERIHTVTVLDSSYVLEDHGDHIEWFNESTSNGLKREIEWHLWHHLEGYLTSYKHWPRGVIESIDREANSVLARIEDPKRPGSWDRRGMVMGSVQSGKTANYTGLICKAIDAGYSLIIVLAGVHNSLRSQTQSRLNEEILGYDLERVQEFSGQADKIGVRLLFRQHRIVQTLTSSSEKGDFKKAVADQAGIIPGPDGHPIIMVVKKHVSILKNLVDWATAVIGQPDDRGNRIVKDVPLLVIDDECDYASVNTKRTVLDEDGKVNEDCDPARTNQRIRELLNSFKKSAYIGYTATPFANIFIHHERQHRIYGDDLFPRNFIISLPQPTNYIGPERVFGVEVQTDNTTTDLEEEKGPARIVRFIDDSDDIIPPQHKKGLVVDILPESLAEAVRAFLISCAVRRLRGCTPSHNSMLIHVTRFTNVQGQIKILVERLLRNYVDRIRSGSDSLADFRVLWETDFVPTSDHVATEYSTDTHTWEEVLEHLYPIARRLRVVEINGTSEDSLAYRNAEIAARIIELRGNKVLWEEKGEQIIAIGGDKLSRGLTLDGLTVSYYLRSCRMYDTLMQMGRWFGYRDGYLDVCRIYTTRELAEWYRHIASASKELRDELDYMALINAEPKDFGLKVLDHPGQLAITSIGKRRDAQSVNLSFSGRISETIVFDLQKSAENLKALERLIQAADAEGKPGKKSGSGILHWEKVNAEAVVRYLQEYKTHSEAVRLVDPEKIAKFILKQLKQSTVDLLEWDIAVLSLRGQEGHELTIDDKTIRCLRRKPMAPIINNVLKIRRLVSPSDEWIDFTENEKETAREKWIELRKEKGKSLPPEGSLPSGPAIRAARPKRRGLLLVYPISHDGSDAQRYGMEEGSEVTGFAVSFPSSDTTFQVNYQVNTVFQDEEV